MGNKETGSAIRGEKEGERIIIGIKTTGTYIPQWFIGKNISKEIAKLFIGRTLIFPCGRFEYGDVKADIMGELHPDILADLTKPETWPWKDQEFDTVFCDPPFSFFVDNRIGWKWINNISSLASKRIIFKTPKVRVKLRKAIWKKNYYIIEDNNGVSFQFLQVFDRKHALFSQKPKDLIAHEAIR